MAAGWTKSEAPAMALRRVNIADIKPSDWTEERRAKR